MSLPSKKPVNYLNNKDILKEIHTSKNAFCTFLDPNEDHKYDFIVDMPTESIEKSLEYANKRDNIKQARETRAARLSVETGTKIDPKSIPVTDLVFTKLIFPHFNILELMILKHLNVSEKVIGWAI